jgi:hypothetical protein
MAEDNGMSMAQIERRIELNKKSGWGLEKGSQPQLNLLALYCHKHHFLPGDDCTLYEGKPWITIDGRVKLMRRNADYRGHTLRPLKPEEKVDWGFDTDDVVIEALVYVAGYPNPIQGHGRVRKAERMGHADGSRMNPIAKIHPVELATKRALARAERFAFGTEAYVDDEDVDDAVQTVVTEAREHQAERAQKYRQIYDAEEEPKKEPLVTMDSTLGQRFAELIEEAARLDVDYSDLKVSFPAPRDVVKEKGMRLRARIDDAQLESAVEIDAAHGLAS